MFFFIIDKILMKNVMFQNNNAFDLLAFDQ